ncbi:palmitoyl-protein thioesterase 1 [Loa loa]|uniref:Palmitoyl-protein thioesterase 1 n=1 Tax=Loa loa TaxID=7209 RepID=A0A1S0UCQ5_LOALO|nr:palmitoyl-protein thioesterase 1 [Loa loa]EFO28409.2 palmitoyl-protein thioesterase 1 [Loa loa]
MVTICVFLIACLLSTGSATITTNSVTEFLRIILGNVEPTPIVLWHGMGDSCCNPLSLGRIEKILKQNIPNVYIYSIMIGSNVVMDTEHGFFGNVNDQVAEVCQSIQKDEKLKNGYNSIGFSQGAQFLRAVAQRCPIPQMKNLISLGGQHQGVFGLPLCPAESYICDRVRNLLEWGAYVGFVQNTVVQAQYWHDPLDEETYRKSSIFLADINNERNLNETYKENLLKLQNLVLVKFLNDTMVVPRESEWFEYYLENDTSKIVPLEKSEIYTEDRLGLRELLESKRLHLLAFEGQHLQISTSSFVSQIVNKFLK